MADAIMDRNEQKAALENILEKSKVRFEFRTALTRNSQGHKDVGMPFFADGVCATGGPRPRDKLQFTFSDPRLPESIVFPVDPDDVKAWILVVSIATMPKDRIAHRLLLRGHSILPFDIESWITAWGTDKYTTMWVRMMEDHFGMKLEGRLPPGDHYHDRTLIRDTIENLRLAVTCLLRGHHGEDPMQRAAVPPGLAEALQDQLDRWAYYQLKGMKKDAAHFQARVKEGVSRSTAFEEASMRTFVKKE